MAENPGSLSVLATAPRSNRNERIKEGSPNAGSDKGFLIDRPSRQPASHIEFPALIKEREPGVTEASTMPSMTWWRTWSTLTGAYPNVLRVLRVSSQYCAIRLILRHGDLFAINAED